MIDKGLRAFYPIQSYLQYKMNCTSDNILEKSISCLNNDTFDCFPTDEKYSLPLGIWMIFTSLVGSTSNLWTIFALGYATHKTLYYLHLSSATTTFVINLAICDLMYCLIHLPIYAAQYLSLGPVLGQTACAATAIVRNINNKTAYMFMAMIAISRSFSIFKSPVLNEYRRWVALGTWIFTFILFSPQLCQKYAEFGYNCSLGRCDKINKLSPPTPDRISDDIQHILPFFLIIVSYTYNGWHFCCHYRHLKNLNIETNLEIRTTWTLFVIFLINAFILGLFNILTSNLDLTEDYLNFAPYSYPIPYCINTFIHLGSTQYRKAYIYFMKKVLLQHQEKSFQNTEAELSTFKQTEQAPHFCQIIPLGLNSRVA